MRGMPFDLQAEEDGFWSSVSTSSNKKRKGFEGSSEPTSVLDNRRSPSPPTSSSTLSSSLGGCGGGGASSDTAGAAAVSASHKWRPSSDWASELEPITAAALEMGDKCGMGQMEDWEAMISESAASPNQEQSFLQWVMADNDEISGGPVDFDGNGAGGLGFGPVDLGFGFEPIGAMGGGAGFPLMNSGSSVKAPNFGNDPIFAPANSLPLPLSLPPGVLYQESMGLVLNQHQQAHSAPNPAFFLPLPPFAGQQHLVLPPHPKRHHPATVEPTCQIPDKNQGFSQQQQQALIDQLFKAAELIEAGNPVTARGILARLNQQLPSPIGKPLLRSAFYFKEALLLLTDTPDTPPSSSPSRPQTLLSAPPANLLDVVLKLGTYKAFSEVSPVVQFTNFTCIQTLLEELNRAETIHIIDFDIGIGGQWSSFMQELAQRRCSSATPLLKITAFASTSSHHPLELNLTSENLTHFATELNIPFEFNVLSLDPFDPSLLLSMCAGAGEAIAVNLPIGLGYHPPVPTLLPLVRQLSPRIVVSVDHGYDRGDLPFSHQFLHAFQSSAVLLDSIDSAGASLDVASKIERFLLRPRIESAMLGRHRAAGKVLPWRSLFASAGFIPVQFSNFTETQAECLLKRVQVRGFHVEKRQSSLFLCWQRGELVSVSAWRC